MGFYPFVAVCMNCGHSSENHSLDDSTNMSPNDPQAKFRCQKCNCPDMKRSAGNLADLESFND